MLACNLYITSDKIFIINNRWSVNVHFGFSQMKTLFNIYVVVKDGKNRDGLSMCASLLQVPKLLQHSLAFLCVIRICLLCFDGQGIRVQDLYESIMTIQTHM